MEDIERWGKMSEWRGYTLKALEDLHEDVKELKITQSSIEGKIDNLNDRLTNIQIKVAGIGGITGLIVSIIMWLITRL